MGDDSEEGWRGRSGHHSVPTRMPVLKEAKDTQNTISYGIHCTTSVTNCSLSANTSVPTYFVPFSALMLFVF